MQRLALSILTLIAAIAAVGSPAAALTIAGQIRYQANGTAVSGVSVDLIGPAALSTTTDANGQYSFTDVAPGSWTIQPHKSGDRRGGVSSRDSLHVLQSVAGAQPLNSSQQLVCDVTGDGVVGYDDAVQILQFLVHSASSFGAEDMCTSSWLFVPFAAAVPGQVLTPPSFAPGDCETGSITLSSLAVDALGQNFEGILIGDCTENWPLVGAALPTLTRTPTRTATGTRSATSTMTATITRTGTRTLTPTITPTVTRTLTPTRTATRTPTFSPSFTPTSTPTRTPTQTRTRTPTPPATLTPSPGGPQLSLGTGITGFTLPVHITNAADGSGRLFVVEQGGLIRLIKNGSVQPTPFLNITARVSCCGERGLLSVAFPPLYTSKRHFYVNYTDTSGNTQVSRFHLTADDDVADANSEQPIISIAQPYSNHNGGQIAFGPDGYLYIGMGDGGSGNDPENRAQNYTTLLGKMLRLHVELPTPTGTPTPYQVPATNPTPLPTVGARPEIWAAGLRNPWRFAFDRLTGDLYIADVGQNAWEEVDFQSAASPGGENYGWRIMEGAHCTNLDPCNQAGLTLPVVEYSHSLGCSITGGHVYRGAAFPCSYGTYFYSDYCSGRIWGLRRNGMTWEATQLYDAPFNITTFGEDEAGTLWVSDHGGGVIYPINDACTAPTPTPTPAG